MTAKQHSTAHSVAITSVGNALPPLVALITAPLLARGLGVEARGDVAAAQAVAMLVISITAFGVPEAITHFVAKGAGRSPKGLRLVASFTLISGAATTLLMVHLAAWLGGTSPDASRLIQLASASVVPSLLLGLARARAAGRGQWLAIACEKVIGSLARLTAVVLLIANGALTPTTATSVMVFGPLAGSLAYLVGSAAPRGGRNTPRTGAFASYSFRVWVGGISGILLMRIDQAILLPVAGSTQLGLYAVAVAISEIPLVLNSAVRDVAFAQHSERFDGQSLSRSARFAALMCAAIAACLALAAPWAIPALFGAEFDAATEVTWLLLIAVVVGTPGSIAGAGLSSVGRPGLRSASLSVAAGVNVVAVMLLAPQWGAVGAAVATLVGNLVSANLNIYWLHRLGACTWTSFYRYERDDFSFAAQRIRELAPFVAPDEKGNRE